MRRLRRMELNFRGRIRWPPPELRRRLPGLLQAKCAARGVRQLVAGIFHHGGTGGKKQERRRTSDFRLQTSDFRPLTSDL